MVGGSFCGGGREGIDISYLLGISTKIDVDKVMPISLAGADSVYGSTGVIEETNANTTWSLDKTQSEGGGLYLRAYQAAEPESQGKHPVLGRQHVPEAWAVADSENLVESEVEGMDLEI